MGFSRQEYWSRSPFPSPGDLPNPGVKLAFPGLARRFFSTEPPGKHDVLKDKYRERENGEKLLFWSAGRKYKLIKGE